MNDKMFDYMVVALLAFAALVFVIVMIRRWLVNVGAREIAIKERRYLGSKMPPGRVVATEGEVGIQADVLKPGLHFVKWPFESVVRKVPLIETVATQRRIASDVEEDGLVGALQPDVEAVHRPPV